MQPEYVKFKTRCGCSRVMAFEHWMDRRRYIRLPLMTDTCFVAGAQIPYGGPSYREFRYSHMISDHTALFVEA